TTNTARPSAAYLLNACSRQQRVQVRRLVDQAVADGQVGERLHGRLVDRRRPLRQRQLGRDVRRDLGVRAEHASYVVGVVGGVLQRLGHRRLEALDQVRVLGDELLRREVGGH